MRICIALKTSLLAMVLLVAGATPGWSLYILLGEAQSLSSTAFTLDLRSYGWEPPEGQQERNVPSILVDHKGRIVLGFTIAARRGLVTRSEPSLDFRIMRFSRDGKVDLSFSLPTHVKGTNAIYLSDTDQIIALAKGTLQLFEANDNSQEGRWKTLCTQPCRVLQSPTRHTLVLQEKNADPPLTIVRFSPQLVLQRCGKVSQPNSTESRFQTYTQYITDEFAYFHGWEPESGYFTYRWPLCAYERRTEVPLGAGGRWTVLNDDLFVMYPYSKGRKGEEMDVVAADGRVKFRPAMQRGELAYRTPVKASERGLVIAVDLVTVKGRNSAVDLAGRVTAQRIAVYDGEAGTQLASIPASPKPRYSFDFDLSADGRRLAILEDDKVRVVDIEGVKADHGLHP